MTRFIGYLPRELHVGGPQNQTPITSQTAKNMAKRVAAELRSTNSRETTVRRIAAKSESIERLSLGVAADNDSPMALPLLPTFGQADRRLKYLYNHRA